ncbi:hypothetical protein [Acinetobacter phage Abp95]|nr:hypothetical protein [Acinetobacter phage Abp95]
MENYKIRVNNEAESKEAQELFFELGYEWHAHGKKVSYLDAIVTGDFGYLVAWKTGCFSEHIIQMGCGREDAKEITLAELRDLVVLKRGDGITDSTTAIQNAINLSINKPKAPALISGADALRALMEGLPVEMSDSDLGMDWTEICVKDGDFKGKVEPCLWMFLNQPEHIEFRLKPQTIKLELEFPKPFEPKHGDWYWFINTNSNIGYSRCQFYNDNDDKKYIKLGAWKTEDEIKQVVEQLGKIKGAV